MPSSLPTTPRLSKAELQRLLEASPIKVYGPAGPDGRASIVYGALPHQVAAHECNAPNLLNLGTRGTGKSRQLRWDAIIRCMMIPNYHALIIRRKMPELRESHLVDIPAEMARLGGESRGYIFLSTLNIAKFPNGSTIKFRHCETEADVTDFLSSQYDFIGFDELSTFTLEQFLKISASCRAPEGAPYVAVVRCCTNPLGLGARWLKQWFIDKNVSFDDYPDYNPDDFEFIFSTLDDNPFVNRKEYEKRLRNLPEHVRRAWLDGEFVVEGAYFTDFRGKKDGKPWHVIDTLPVWSTRTFDGHPLEGPITDFKWISIYRAIDWGYDPDPAVCLWIAVLPNKRAIVFKEMKWRRTLAKDVAQEIKRASAGMHIVESFCDPTMFIKDGAVAFSIAEIFEQNGVPLTPSYNDREKYGYAIVNHLCTLIDDLPQLQIVKPGMHEWGCADLIRTLPLIERDSHNPSKLANGEDHWVVALAYFCMGLAMPSHDPAKPDKPLWQQPKWRRMFGVKPL